MKKKILILLLFFLSISIVFAQEPKKTRETFGEVTCKDDGSITFTREPRYKKFNVERISDNKIFTESGRFLILSGLCMSTISIL